jgi:hypothetical protein
VIDVVMDAAIDDEDGGLTTAKRWDEVASFRLAAFNMRSGPIAVTAEIFITTPAIVNMAAISTTLLATGRRVGGDSALAVDR